MVKTQTRVEKLDPEDPQRLNLRANKRAKKTEQFRIRLKANPPAESVDKFLRTATPADVRKFGYGFTERAEDAWRFASMKQAEAKILILLRHFGGDPSHVSLLARRMESEVTA